MKWNPLLPIDSAGHVSTSRRKGIVLATVILCLLITTAMIGNLVRATTVLSRQSTHRSQRLQLQILTEDALDLAMVRYQGQESYSGESWVLMPEQWALKQTGHVQIRIEKKSGKQTTLTVQGTLKQGEQVLQRLTRTMNLQ